MPCAFPNLPFNERTNNRSVMPNITSKSIKGIQGVLTIKDLFGEKIISLNCDFTGKIIPTNDNRTYEGIGFDINQFMDDHIKVYNENFEDLIFECLSNNIHIYFIIIFLFFLLYFLHLLTYYIRAFANKILVLLNHFM